MYSLLPSFAIPSYFYNTYLTGKKKEEIQVFFFLFFFLMNAYLMTFSLFGTYYRVFFINVCCTRNYYFRKTM